MPSVDAIVLALLSLVPIGVLAHLRSKRRRDLRDEKMAGCLNEAVRRQNAEPELVEASRLLRRNSH